MENLNFSKRLFLSIIIIIVIGFLISLEVEKSLQKVLSWLLAIFIFGTILQTQIYIYLRGKKKKEEIKKLKEEFKRWYLKRRERHYEEYWIGLEKFTLDKIKSEIEKETKLGKRILKEIKKKGSVETAFNPEDFNPQKKFAISAWQ